jgi:chromosome partitioning protein
MVTTIAVGSQKGGVAKTTTSLSLGACLAELGQMVLLIDLDPQGHLSVSLGLKPEKLRHTVSDVFLGDASLVSVSRESAVFGMDIVPANRELVLVDKLLYGRQGYEFRLREALEGLGHDLYDVVLIDCPPSLGTLTLNALTAANLLIVPAQCEYYAARSLHQIVDIVKLVRRKTNPELVYRLLITMYDKRNRICRLIHDQMRDTMSQVIFDTIIEVDTKLRESPAFGQPITLYAPNTRGAEQYRALAQELLNDDGHRATQSSH